MRDGYFLMPKERQDGTLQEVLESLIDRLEPWQDQHARSFISVEVGDVPSHLPVRSRATAQWLTDQVMERSGRVIRQTQVREAVRVLDVRGRSSGRTARIWTRSALHEGHLYIDLADGSGRAVQVTTDGSEVVDEVPVRFFRSERAEALPVPKKWSGQKIPELPDLINLPDRDAQLLFFGALVAALWPEGARPITVFQGEHGTAKTTAARMFVSMTDPQTSPVQSLPRGDQDLALACMSQRVLAFDNLSDLNQRESDRLCRVSTGASHATRALYTDSEMSVIPAQASLVLTGVGSVLDRPDAIDRAIVFDMARLAEGSRMAEGDLWPSFHEAQPHFFSLLLDGLELALRHRHEVDGPLPRMADAARVAAASMPAIGAKASDFLEAHRRNEVSHYRAAIEASPFGPALVDLVQEHEEWEGTHTDLLAELGRRVRSKGPGWPRAANVLSSQLTRLRPALASQGIEVEDFRSSDRASRKILRLTDRQASEVSEPPPAGGDAVIRRSHAEGREEPVRPDANVPPPQQEKLLTRVKQRFGLGR